MHTVIIGAGGVGGYFGGRIAHSGQKVTFVARGKHLEAMRGQGLRVKSINGDFNTDSFQATDRIEEVQKADLILICTKSWQVAEAGALITPILQETTIVIPLQNGADNAEKLCSVLDSKYVLGGLCKMYSKIEAPGIISHFGHSPEIVFGELDKANTDRLQIPKAIFDKAGIANTISDDIHVDIWSKFMFIATVSGLGALTRATIGEMYQNPETRNIMSQTATEIYEVANAKKVALPEDLVQRMITFIGTQPFESTASTQRDIMEGRPSELDNFNGFLVREGKKLGVATPINQFIYSCLKPMENKARS